MVKGEEKMIDLHMHTRASDGTDHVEELLQKLKETGISVFSVTDHDTIDGAMDMEYLVPSDMRFIRGIEFTAITEAGKCHILGYGMDWNKRAFRSILEEGAEKRANKLNRRLRFLKEEFDIELPENELQMLRSQNSVCKPHLGSILVSMGLAPDKKTAIEKYIDPCKTQTDRLDGAKVIEAILASGGVPVWAHPFGGTDEKEVPVPQFEKQLEVLTRAGLMGLECYYSKYTRNQIDMLVSIAEERHLCISGGSDYHGGNKQVRLGTLNADGFPVDSSMMTVLDAVSEKTKNRKVHLFEIVEGHDRGTYFWIMPVRVLDMGKRTDDIDNLEEMKEQEISLEEHVFSDFLHLVFRRHFDNDLPENAGRSEEYAPEKYKDGIAFEWYLTDNFYTLDGIMEVVADIRQVVKQLSSDPDEETKIQAKGNIPELIDFYERFCEYMENMVQAARKGGYSLISVCGP